jgi:hypothetical protein
LPNKQKGAMIFPECKSFHIREIMKKIAALLQSTTFASLIVGLCLALPAAAQTEPESCSKTLVGEILKAKLGIDFGDSALNDDRGDVIELACKAHPTRPGLTIVALFHSLKDARGETEQDKSGFAVAVIDQQRRTLHGLYRKVFQEDATIRSSGPLFIDTARYQLKRGMRAFGVRMNTGYGPRCADGGWNSFLTLFVEEGNQLTPVLEMLPMNSWSYPEGNKTCGEEPQGGVFESTAWSLALSATTTAGWRDLDVFARTTVDTAPAADGSTAQARPRLVYKLRKKGQLYSQD